MDTNRQTTTIRVSVKHDKTCVNMLKTVGHVGNASYNTMALSMSMLTTYAINIHV
jgi:hypothetical protein